MIPSYSDPEGSLRNSFRPEIRIVEDRQALSRVAAEEWIARAKISVEEKGLFTISLSGGSMPRGLYSLLATDPSLRTQLPWDKIHFFWGDERHVPPDHPDSNYGMAREALLSKVPVPPENVHPIPGEVRDVRQAAAAYEERLRDFFQLKAGEFPRFDFVLLGMGADGHTASLFPGTEALRERRHLVVASWVEKLRAFRITLTIPVFNHAAFLLFLVSGEEKAEILEAVFEDGEQRELLPSQLIRPAHGRLVWLADKAAARLLQRPSSSTDPPSLTGKGGRGKRRLTEEEEKT